MWGTYSREETIQERKLYEEIWYIDCLATFYLIRFIGSKLATMKLQEFSIFKLQNCTHYNTQLDTAAVSIQS